MTRTCENDKKNDKLRNRKLVFPHTMNDWLCEEGAAIGVRFRVYISKKIIGV